MPNSADSHRQHGVVTWFDWRKGFGFILPDTACPGGAAGLKALSDEIFVSYEDVQRDGFKTLSAGERVSFELKAGDGGRRASLVEVLEPGEAQVREGANEDC